MKSKIVQKIMAAVISIATISSAPGLTSAVKTSTTPWAENGKKRNGRKKNPEKIKGRRKNKKAAKAPRKSKEEREIEKLEKMFEKLRKKKKKDEKNVQLNQNNITDNENINSENIQNEIEMTQEENASESANIQNESEIAEEEENMLTTIEILENCCQDVGARKNVANSILALTMRGSFKNKSKEEILRAIGMLKLCIKDDSSKATAARVIDRLAYCGYFIGWTTEDILKIFEVLTKCAEQQAALQIVWNAVRCIDTNVCFKNWNGQDFKELLNSLSKFSQNYSATQFITRAISSVLPTVNVRSKKPANVPQKVDANQNINIQKNETGPENVDANQNANIQKNETGPEKVDDNIDIVNHILEMSKKANSNSIKQIQIEISEKIFKYLENKDPKQQIEIITELAKNKCFKYFKKTNLMKIFEMLEKYTKNEDLKLEVSKAVLELNKIVFFNVQSVTENAICEKLLDILLACDEKSCDKSNILSSLTNLIENPFRYYDGPGLKQNHQVKILNLLKAGIGYQNSKKSASHAFAAICDKKIYKNFNEELAEEFSKIKDEVFKFIKITTANSDDFDKKDFAFILKVMIENNFLNQEELTQSVGILEKCLENDSAQEDILNAIKYLSNVEGPWRLSRETALKIISMLKKYITNEQNKEAVLGLISRLARACAFKNATKEETLKMLDLLERFDLTTEHHKFLASKIIVHLIDEGFFEVFSPEKFPNVKELLFKPNSNHKHMLTYLPQIISAPEMNTNYRSIRNFNTMSRMFLGSQTYYKSVFNLD